MRQLTKLAGSTLLAAALAAALTACSSGGDLAFSNEGPDDVTVSTGDQEFTVESDGGVHILGYGCTEGDTTVRFPSGQEIVLTERVCPDQQIVIRDGAVDLHAASDS